MQHSTQHILQPFVELPAIILLLLMLPNCMALLLLLMAAGKIPWATSLGCGRALTLTWA